MKYPKVVSNTSLVTGDESVLIEILVSINKLRWNQKEHVIIKICHISICEIKYSDVSRWA